jgi:hypothetical protein
MKHVPFARKIPRRLSALGFALLLSAPAAARAAECPESSPEDAQERRKLAKEWFSTAETAENTGDDVEATRAYACSYKMVPHPYTAFNLARVTERAGDNELSLKMYKAYLALKPEARDKEEVKVKIKALEDKIAAKETPPAEPVASPETPSEPVPEPPKDELTPPPEPKPADVITRPEPPPESEPRGYLVEWIVGGVTVGALIGGIATNFIARAKMDTCRTDSKNEMYKSANNQCNAARPMAYTSYALFGVAAAGIATDTVLLIVRKMRGSAEPVEDSPYSFMLLPGGAGLTARGRF